MKKTLLVLFLLLLIGCSKTIQSGKIIGKNYYPAYSTEENVVVSEIDTGDIKIPIYGTETVNHPAKWEIVILNELDGKVIQRTVPVTESTYNLYEKDDWIELK